MADLKTTIIQSDIIWEDRDKNLENFSHKLGQINGHPNLIILPEMFATGFTMNVKKCAEKQTGSILIWMKKLARKKNCVIAGSALIEEDDQFFNRMFWVSPEGHFETYNKRHLFRMGNEHQTMAQGFDRKIVELNGWKINLQICYDLRFPVFSRNHFRNGQYDYDALLYVANWPEVRSPAYKALLKARAIENQCYVIWVNRVGPDGNKINYTGDSMIIDPYGEIICRATEGKEQNLTGILSRQKIIDFRNKFTVGMDWDDFDII